MGLQGAVKIGVLPSGFLFLIFSHPPDSYQEGGKNNREPEGCGWINIF
jgi:hypothetical protein